MYNILIGGEAGQGIETTAAILEKLIKKSGHSVFTSRDFMSRVRGGHNFSMIRFGTEEVTSAPTAVHFASEIALATPSRRHFQADTGSKKAVTGSP